MPQTFTERLKALKKEARLTQQGIADLLGVSKRTVEEWTRGGSEPPKYLQPLYLEALEKRTKQIEELRVEIYPTESDIKKRIEEIVESGEPKALVKHEFRLVV